jgi:hypothetical protein
MNCHFIGSDLSDSLFLPYDIDESEVVRDPKLYPWIKDPDKRRLLFTFAQEDARTDERTIMPNEVYNEARTDPAMIALTLTLQQYALGLIAGLVGIGILVYLLASH